METHQARVSVPYSPAFFQERKDSEVPCDQDRLGLPGEPGSQTIFILILSG
jgi:hypothetical protein